MLFAGLVAASLIVVLQDKNAPVIAVALVIAMGAPCPLLAWRLIVGRMRTEDGGFFSPTEMRLAGICFALSPLVAIGRIWFFEWMFRALGIALACFALARQRSNAIQAYVNSDEFDYAARNADVLQNPIFKDQPEV